MMRHIRSFISNPLGNVSIILALSLVPIMLAGGVAIDYVRTSQAQAQLQSAVDAAALAGGNDKLTNAELKASIIKYLQVSKAQQLIEALDTVKVVRVDKDTLRVEANGAIDASLMKLAGLNKLEVKAVSEVKRSYGSMEVSLVLDNTASMGQGQKLPNLKKSANKFVDTVFGASGNPNVRMSLVPFSSYVNVGVSHRSDDWLKVDNDKTVTQNVCNWVQENQTNCRTQTCTWNNDGTPVSYDCQVCDGDWTEKCSDQEVNYTWNGCVGSRNYPMNVDGTEPKLADTSTLYPGLINTWCSNPVVPLTSDKSKLKNEINNMGASGETYIPIGLEWGWNMLSHEEPFTEAASYSDSTQKVLVLMTDGENTLSPTYPYHYGNNAALTNNLTLEICTNIKSKGIVIYAVSYEVSSTAINDLLSSCATEPGNYFDADNDDELAAAFATIGDKMASLRVSR